MNTLIQLVATLIIVIVLSWWGMYGRAQSEPMTNCKVQQSDEHYDIFWCDEGIQMIRREK